MLNHRSANKKKRPLHLIIGFLFFLMGAPTVFAQESDCACFENNGTIHVQSIGVMSQYCAEKCANPNAVYIANNLCDCDPVESEDEIVTCSSVCAQEYPDSTAAKTPSTAASSSPTTTTAPPTSEPIKFVTPTLNVPIPNLTFTPISEQAGFLHINFLGEYLTALYQWLIGSSMVIAIVMIMAGGLLYTLAGASPEMAGKGKKLIWNAVTGFVLLMSVYLILYTVNPQLVIFPSLVLENIEPLPEETFDPGDVPTNATGGAVCHTIEDCRTLCAQPSDRWPTSTSKTINEKEVSLIKDSDGLVNTASVKGTQELQEALKRAGEVVKKKNNDYQIVLTSGYRTLKRQIELVCNDYLQTGREKEIGSSIAWPGASNHGNGIAVDLQLWEDEKKLTISGDTTAQANPEWKEGAKVLAELMAEAGFVRYSKEIWHFEIESKASSDCRCKGAACPFPPKC